MFNLIRRTTDICAKFGIDQNKLFEVKDLYDYFKGETTPVIIGTVVKYITSDGYAICILLTNGWHKTYSPCRREADIIRIVRDLRKNSFKRITIANVLNITTDMVSHFLGEDKKDNTREFLEKRGK